MKMKFGGLKSISIKKKKSLYGYIFTLPFILGFIFIFMSAIILYITISFTYTYPSFEGMVLKNVGFENYYQVLFVDPDYIGNVLSSLGSILITCPAILLYSFFIAVILNKKFKGMTVFRALFFLPVITASGYVAMQSDGLLAQSIALFSGSSGSGDTLNLTKVLIQTFSSSFDLGTFNIVEGIVNKIFTVIMSSGVQIIIFLAGLQTIPRSLYEASSIEGSTNWEDFWKITLPMISSLVVVNAVYTIIDQMAGVNNPVLAKMYEYGIQQGKLGYAAAMGLMYFFVMFIILGLLIGFINKFVFYENR